MRGRLSGIRRTLLLRISAGIHGILALFFLLFSILYLKEDELWFFVFLICCGSFLLTRSFLFHSDSSFYFGSLLLQIGMIGTISVYYLLPSATYLFATALVSLLTMLVFKQKFHLIISCIFLYAGINTLCYQLGIINLTIFLSLFAILLFIFFVFCVMIVYKFKRRK